MSAVKCHFNLIFKWSDSRICGRLELTHTLGSRCEVFTTVFMFPRMLVDRCLLFTAWHMWHSRSLRCSLACTLPALISFMNRFSFFEMMILTLSFLLVEHQYCIWLLLLNNCICYKCLNLGEKKVGLQDVKEECHTGSRKAACGLFHSCVDWQNISKQTLKQSRDYNL